MIKALPAILATLSRSLAIHNVICGASWLTWVGVLLGPTMVTSRQNFAVAVEFIEIIEKQFAEKNLHMHGFRIENFDQWVFSSQQKIGEAKQKLMDRLQGEADSIQLTCKLESEQKEKLLLAGRGDIHAFLQLYSEVRAKFAEKLQLNDQQAIQNIWQEIQPLQQQYHGQIFRAGSLFEKVLDRLLDEQQSARIDAHRRDQRKFQFQAAVMQLVSQIDQVAPIKHVQREKLLALIDRHVLPPKSMVGHSHNHLLLYYVLGQMAKIPQDELRPLFGKAAWKVIQQQIKQGKSMKRHLAKQGLVAENE